MSKCTHKHIHMYLYIFIYIYSCMYIYVSICVCCVYKWREWGGGVYTWNLHIDRDRWANPLILYFVCSKAGLLVGFDSLPPKKLKLKQNKKHTHLSYGASILCMHVSCSNQPSRSRICSFSSRSSTHLHVPSILFMHDSVLHHPCVMCVFIPPISLSQ